MKKPYGTKITIQFSHEKQMWSVNESKQKNKSVIIVAERNKDNGCLTPAEKECLVLFLIL